MTKFFVLIVFLLSSSLAAAELCEVVIHPQNSRRVDVQFPGKVVSVVGHQHPRREDADAARSGFEQYLWSTFLYLETLRDSQTMRSEIQQYTQQDATALKHWKEDLNTLEEALRYKTHRYFAVEMSSSNLQSYDQYSGIIYSNIATGAYQLGLSSSQTADLQVIAMSVPFYTRVAKSALFGRSEVISVEPSEDQITAYNETFCPKKVKKVGKEQLAADELIASLRARGFSDQVIEEGLKLGIERVEDLLRDAKPEQIALVDNEKLLEIYRSAFSMTLTEDELRNLRTVFIRGSNERKESRLDVNYIMKNLPRLIDEYDVCWGRDALIAKNLALQSGSTMMFIGIGHLAPQAALLKRECLQQLQDIERPRPRP